MADIDVLSEWVTRALRTKEQIPFGVYEDESTISDPRNFAWLHGGNIPLFAILCDTINLFNDRQSRLSTAELLRFWRTYTSGVDPVSGELKAPLCNNEEWSVIYGHKHYTAVYIVSAFTNGRSNPTYGGLDWSSLRTSCDDWFRAWYGFVGWATAPWPGKKLNESDPASSAVGPVWLHATVDVPKGRGELHSDNGKCTCFGKRSASNINWSEWVWVHENGFDCAVDMLYGTVKDIGGWVGTIFQSALAIKDRFGLANVFPPLPIDDLTEIRRAVSGAPASLEKLATWYTKHPSNGKYIIERYDNAIVFYSPNTTGGSTSPGEACITYKPKNGETCGDTVWGISSAGSRNDSFSGGCERTEEGLNLFTNQGSFPEDRTFYPFSKEGRTLIGKLISLDRGVTFSTTTVPEERPDTPVLSQDFFKRRSNGDLVGCSSDPGNPGAVVGYSQLHRFPDHIVLRKGEDTSLWADETYWLPEDGRVLLLEESWEDGYRYFASGYKQPGVLMFPKELPRDGSKVQVWQAGYTVAYNKFFPVSDGVTNAYRQKIYCRYIEKNDKGPLNLEVIEHESNQMDGTVEVYRFAREGLVYWSKSKNGVLLSQHVAKSVETLDGGYAAWVILADGREGLAWTGTGSGIDGVFRPTGQPDTTIPIPEWPGEEKKNTKKSFWQKLLDFLMFWK